MPKKKETRGGARAGAGRKSPFAEKTRLVHLRLPTSAIELIDGEAQEHGLTRAVVVAKRFGVNPKA